MAAVLLALLLQESGRSLYVWKTESADAKLLTFSAERRVSRLYLMVGPKATDEVRAFVRSAHEAKIQVHAMHPGDMAEWLDAFPAKLDHKVIVDWVWAVAKEGI